MIREVKVTNFDEDDVFSIKNIIKYCIITGIMIYLQRFRAIQLITFILLLIYAFSGVERAIKACIYSFVLSSLNTNIAISANQVITMIRWLILFTAFFRIIFYQIKCDKIIYRRSFNIFNIFILINVLSSVFFSINLKVSILKLVSYFIGMYVFIVGMSITRRNKWIVWILNLFIILNMLSIFTLLLNESGYYYRNKSLFTGVLIHPNIYSAFSVIALSYYIFIYINKIIKNNLYLFTIFILTYITINLTKSRAGILFSSILLVIFLFNILIERITNMKIVITCIISTIIILYMCVNINSILININSIVYKGGSQGVFDSRETQIERVLDLFYDNPLLGKGFGVDENNIIASSSLLSAPTEKGNIILAILSESGIIGLLVFSIFIVIFIVENLSTYNYSLILVIISFICTNMTEATYFSISNIGILNCMIMGLYMSLSKRRSGIDESSNIY